MKIQYLPSLTFMLICLLPATSMANSIDGKSIYDKNCKSCHDTGIGGAPKTGQKADWKDRLETGIKNLEMSAINGVQGYGGNMPARGGNPKLTDDEVKAAVAYIIKTLK